MAVAVRADETQCPYCGQPISRKQYREIRGQIEAQATASIAKAEQAQKERFAEQVKLLKANQETNIKRRLEAQRQTLEKAKAEAVAAERTKAYAERMRLDTHVQDLQRKLQRKTANELGEEGEADVFEALRREFPHDTITRVAKGIAGPDIIHRIVHNGTVIGTILVDSKNTSRFLPRFATKLRADQLREQADQAIISTTAFPPGARQLTLVNNVIVAAPAWVPVVMQFLRGQIVQIHLLRVGNEVRQETAEALRQFIVSPAGIAPLERIVSSTDNLANLDAREKQAHDKVWRERAALIAAIRDAKEQFSDAIKQIIGTMRGKHAR
jgi:hypothetical protein